MITFSTETLRPISCKNTVALRTHILLPHNQVDLRELVALNAFGRPSVCQFKKAHLEGGQIRAFKMRSIAVDE